MAPRVALLGTLARTSMPRCLRASRLPHPRPPVRSRGRNVAVPCGVHTGLGRDRLAALQGILALSKTTCIGCASRLQPHRETRAGRSSSSVQPLGRSVAARPGVELHGTAPHAALPDTLASTRTSGAPRASQSMHPCPPARGPLRSVAAPSGVRTGRGRGRRAASQGIPALPKVSGAPRAWSPRRQSPHRMLAGARTRSPHRVLAG